MCTFFCRVPGDWQKVSCLLVSICSSRPCFCSLIRSKSQRGERSRERDLYSHTGVARCRLVLFPSQSSLHPSQVCLSSNKVQLMLAQSTVTLLSIECNLLPLEREGERERVCASERVNVLLACCLSVLSPSLGAHFRGHFFACCPTATDDSSVSEVCNFLNEPLTTATKEAVTH